MSVEHLKGLSDEALKELGQLGIAAERDPRKLQRDIEGIERHIRQLAFAVSVAVQEGSDDIAALREKLEQARQVHERAMRIIADLHPEPAPAPESTPAPAVEEPTAPADDTEPTAPVDEVTDEDFLDGIYTRDELQGMTNERLSQLAESYSMDTPVGWHNRVAMIDRILAAQHRWCVENDEEDPNEPARTTRQRVVEIIDIRQWRGANWVGALLGALVALILWSFWPEWPGRNIDEEWIKTTVNFTWFLAHLGVGFFGGAMLGAWLEERNSHDE